MAGVVWVLLLLKLGWNNFNHITMGVLEHLMIHGSHMNLYVSFLPLCKFYF